MHSSYSGSVIGPKMSTCTLPRMFMPAPWTTRTLGIALSLQKRLQDRRGRAGHPAHRYGGLWVRGGGSVKGIAGAVSRKAIRSRHSGRKSGGRRRCYLRVRANRHATGAIGSVVWFTEESAQRGERLGALGAVRSRLHIVEQ